MSDRKPTFAPFTDAELCEIEDRFGRVEVVTGAPPPARKWRPDDVPECPWQAVFRAPTPGEGNRFEAAANSATPGPMAEGVRNIASDTIVALSRLGTKTIANATGPGQKAVREAWAHLRDVEGYPGAHLAAQTAIMSLHGMTAADAGKG